MRNLAYFLLTFVLTRFAFSQFAIRNITNFPLPLGRPFEITVSIFPSPIFTLELMIIQTTDLNGFDKDVAIFDFGLKEVNNQEFHSEYMKIPIWGKSVEKETIFVMINFTQYAHNRILEVYYINPNSTKERRSMLNDLKSTQRMYRNNIRLLIPPQLELKLDSQIRNEITVEPNSSLVVTCQASNGQPEIKPEILKSDLKIESEIFFPDSNIQKITIRTSMRDHNRTLTCQAGKITKSAKIFIYHAPTKILLEPEVENVLGIGSGIICSALNGYPIPRITWNIIDGPLNATLYYQIAPYTQRLYIKENAPIGSLWKFICSATNSFFGLSTTFNKTVSFTIIYQQRNKTQPPSNSHPNATKINNGIWGPDKMSYALKQIEEIKLEIFLRDIAITNLRNSLSMQKAEIFQLNKTIHQLRENQREAFGDIRLVKKLINIEIENMKKELKGLKENRIDKNKVLPTRLTESPTTTARAVTLPSITFDWRINGVSRLRRKGKSFRSETFTNPQVRFPVTLYFKFRRMESMLISVHMSRINDAESSLVINGDVIISIYNAENLLKQKSRRISFQRDRRSTNVKFVFNYFDLHMNQVLQSDDIIVKCALSITN